MLSVRISAYHLEVRRAPEISVPCPGWKYQAVSRYHIQLLTARTADQQRGATKRNSQHFMGTGMVMLIIEDTVCPDACPTVCSETTVEIGSTTVSKKPSVNQYRKMRIVRDPVARLEKYCLGVHAEFPRYLSIAARRRPSIRRRCSPKSYAAFSIELICDDVLKAKLWLSPAVP